MRRVVLGYADKGPDSADRTDRLVALLAVGMERLLRSRKEAVKNPDTAVDFPPDLSVTTDCQSNGNVEEG
jgi:hypothetical protein